MSAWGFNHKYGRWYYKDHYVEMGDLLPLPEELEPKEPLAGKELMIQVSLTPEYENGKIRISVKSNIPESTPLIFTLKGKKYRAQSKSVVHDGTIISEWFSDHDNPIKEGFYTIEVTCPIYNVLPDKVKRIFGERSRNICGSCVKFDPIGGNTIHFSYGLIIRNKDIRTIDMQQEYASI